MYNCVRNADFAFVSIIFGIEFENVPTAWSFFNTYVEELNEFILYICQTAWHLCCVSLLMSLKTILYKFVKEITLICTLKY